MSDISIQRKVGLRIRELRTERGVSQERFAYSINMARTYFTEVENGKRNVSLENLEKIVRGLGVTFSEFFDPEMFRQPPLTECYLITCLACGMSLIGDIPQAFRASGRRRYGNPDLRL